MRVGKMFTDVADVAADLPRFERAAFDVLPLLPLLSDAAPCHEQTPSADNICVCASEVMLGSFSAVTSSACAA